MGHVHVAGIRLEPGDITPRQVHTCPLTLRVWSPCVSPFHVFDTVGKSPMGLDDSNRQSPRFNAGSQFAIVVILGRQMEVKKKVVGVDHGEVIEQWLRKHRLIYTGATRHPLILSIRDGTVHLSAFKRWLVKKKKKTIFFVGMFVRFSKMGFLHNGLRRRFSMRASC